MVDIIMFVIIVGLPIGIIIFFLKMFKAMKETDNKVKRKKNYYDNLLELQRLKEKNIITEEEFEKEKEKIKP